MEPVQPPSVGRNIQRIRKQQQLTLGVLAERSGVSKAMLSQIESEKVNPTVATVWKIARGLEVDLDELLKGAEVPVRKFLLARQEEHTALEGPRGAPRIEVLSPVAMAEDLEIYLLTFQQGGVLRSSPHAPQTEEYLTVIEGRVEVRAGGKSGELGPGDFVIYSCDVEHSIENLAEGPSRVHMIVRFVRRQWE
jgi:transcriptional regulator with XRE-family HTH domain